MDRTLGRELDAIARDNRSGAAELVVRAVNAIQRYAQRHPSLTEPEWLAIAKRLLQIRPSMVSFFRLANEITVALERNAGTRDVLKRVNAFEKLTLQGPQRIARHFRKLLRRETRPYIHTYSYSSTVLAALLHAKPQLHTVWCSESRPANEGQAMAQRLARAEICTYYSTDACMMGQLCRGHIVLLGADAVLTGWVAGKVGIKPLIQGAIANGCRVYILADTSKFWPESSGKKIPRWEWTFGPDEEVWRNPPRNVEVYNLYFELVPYRKDSRFRFLTERGLMTPGQVRRAIAQITLSRRLKELMD